MPATSRRGSVENHEQMESKCGLMFVGLEKCLNPEKQPNLQGKLDDLKSLRQVGIFSPVLWV